MPDIVLFPQTKTISISLGESASEAARQAGLATTAAATAQSLVNTLGSVPTSDEVIAAAGSTNGLTVTVAGGVIERLGSANVAFAGSVVLDPVPTTNAVNVAYQLTYTNGVGGWTFCSAKLADANITNLVVKDAASGAALALGVDYVADLRFGALALFAAGAARNVLVSYTASQERYDLIYVDPEFLEINVVKGTAAVRDAGERIPNTGTKPTPQTLIDMRLQLFHAKVTAAGVALVKVWNLRA